MKILHIGTFPYPSPQGSQVYVKSILLGLARLGHQVELLCYGHGVGSTEIEGSMGISIHRVPKIFGYNNMRAGPDFTKPVLDAWMGWKLRQLRPDVIHVHNYEAPLVAILGKVLAKHLRGVPIVYSAHNTMQEELPTYFTGRLTKRLMQRFGTLLDKTIPSIAEQSLVLREQSVSTLKTLGCTNVEVVMPGIDPEEFLDLSTLRARKPQGMEEGHWVVYAGNPDAYQNIEILMAAMETLPHVGIVMVSASDTTGWVRENGTVLHIQTSDFTVVQQVIANADLAVIPRMVCAGFPMKLLNYLALECVTLVSEGSVVDLPGVVSFTNGNVEELSDAIADLLQDDQRRNQLSKQARNGIFRDCTHAAQAEKMVKIYTNLLKT